MRNSPSDWRPDNSSKSAKSTLRTVGRNLFWPALLVFMLAAPATQWIPAGVSLSVALLSLLVGACTKPPTSRNRGEHQ